MSSKVTIRVICEGPTDTIVVRGAVAALGIDAVITQIQPEDNGNLLGQFGGGWKGVRGWCENASKTGMIEVVLGSADLLVIHVDADIAHDRRLDLLKPCPPATDTANAVRAKILKWLGTASTPDGVVLCVPAMATEAWVFCALFPEDQLTEDIECRRDPAALLTGKKPKLVAKKRRRYVKNLDAYKKALPRITTGWKQPIPHLCQEGARFIEELKAVIA